MESADSFVELSHLNRKYSLDRIEFVEVEFRISGSTTHNDLHPKPVVNLVWASRRVVHIDPDPDRRVYQVLRQCRILKVINERRLPDTNPSYDQKDLVLELLRLLERLKEFARFGCVLEWT